jgi:hypothetical protein
MSPRAPHAVRAAEPRHLALCARLELAHRAAALAAGGDVRAFVHQTLQIIHRLDDALLRREPPQPRRLDDVLRHTLAVGMEAAQPVARGTVALRRRQPPQSRGLRGVLGHALAVQVDAAEPELRVDTALLSRQPPQPCRLRMVLRHAIAVGEDAAEVELRERVALLGGQPPQPHGLRTVSRHAPGLEVQPRLNCASAPPFAAPSDYSRAASAWFCSTPRPLE